MPRKYSSKAKCKSEIAILDFSPAESAEEDITQAQASTVLRAGKAPELRTVEISSVSSRCSFRMVHEIVSKFDAAKRHLVTEIGFGGLLEFPPTKQIDRRFAVSLMCRVDHLTRTLVLDKKRRIEFSKTDVNKIFGIPCGGRRVDDLCTNKDTVRKIITEYLGSTQKNGRSIKPATHLITKDYNGKMTEAEMNAFKVAFVIYIMSTVLSPGAKFDYVSYDYWSAIENPSKIRSFDWSEYVMEKMLDGVVKLKSELKCHSKIANLTGCALFLQVLYLDSADLGLWSMDHTDMPRIKCFSGGRMRSMILADSRQQHLDSPEREYAPSRLRSPATVCYHWAAKCMQGICVDAEKLKHGLWKANTALLRMLHVPEDIDPAAYRAFNEFDFHISDVARLAAIRYLSKWMSLIRPIARGGVRLDVTACTESSTTKAYELETPIKIGTVTKHHMTASSWQDLDEAMEHDMELATVGNLKQSGSKASFCSHEQKFLDYPCIIYLSSTRRQCPIDLTTIDRGMNKKNKLMEKWRGQTELTRMGKKADEFINTLTALQMENEDSSAIILHFVPKYIEVKIKDLVPQLLGEEEFSMDMFNALIRRIKQKDDKLEAGEHSKRWRHYFEAEFLESVILGNFNVQDPYIKDQLVGAHIGYNVHDCDLLFFPTIVKHRWILYTWDISANQIAIFDPFQPAGSSDQPDNIHYSAIKNLKRCMHEVSKTVLKEWHHDFQSVKIRFMADFRTPRECLSGLMCSYFCMTFDGNEVQELNPVSSKSSIGAMILSEIISIDGNCGKIPGELLRNYFMYDESCN